MTTEYRGTITSVILLPTLFLDTSQDAIGVFDHLGSLSSLIQLTEKQ